MRTLAILLAVALAGCTGLPAHLTIDGQDAHIDSLSGSVTSDATHELLRLNLSDNGPPNVTDSGQTYSFRVDLAVGVPAGETLAIDGLARVTSDEVSIEPIIDFTPGDGHDPRVLAVSAQIECFCGAPSVTLEQSVSGTVEILEVRTDAIVVSVDLHVDGAVPPQTGIHHFHVTGRFEARR